MFIVIILHKCKKEEKLYEELAGTVCTHNKMVNVIITSDLNGKVGTDRECYIVGPNGLGQQNDNSGLLQMTHLDVSKCMVSNKR